MLPSDLTLPTRNCHTCRRRRWKCDRSLPVCHKCSSSGSECLGYGKLFVWNQGVASRGKMMGKSYEEKLASKRSPVSTRQPVIQHGTQDDGGSVEFTSEVEELPRKETEMTVHSALVDPLIQDLSPNSRYYIYHFATQICQDIVIHDGPGQNPFRDLLPATAAYPSLLHLIVANSAFHVFNISRDPITQPLYQLEKRPCLVAYYQNVSRFGGPMKTSYADALLAKQQALSLFAQCVASVNKSNIDITLASILLFINYDLIESGRDKWKVHMEGARKLIERLDTPPYLQRPMSRLRLTLLSDALVFFIIGTTFTFSTTRALIPESIDLDPILRYAETNNYLSCPAPLLSITVKSFSLEDTRQSLSDHVAVDVQNRIGVLLKAALDFDPLDWTRNFEHASPFENLDHRMHIASAHRAAVCIYLVRCLPYTNPLIDPSSGSALVNLTELVNEILHHVSFFRPGDTLYKSISWPLFLAGAECDDPVQRTWIMDKLDEFYHLLYWGYVHTIKQVLGIIWTCKDKAGQTSDVCWINDIKELGDIIIG